MLHRSIMNGKAAGCRFFCCKQGIETGTKAYLEDRYLPAVVFMVKERQPVFYKHMQRLAQCTMNGMIRFIQLAVQQRVRAVAGGYDLQRHISLS